MASYQRLPSGNWRALYYVNGQRRSLTRPTRRECVKAIEQQGLIRNGALTVGDALNEYIVSRSHTVSPATLYGYNNLRKFHFLGLQKVRIDDLTETKINMAIGEEATKYSPKTVKNAWGLVNAALSAHLPTNMWKIQLPQKAKKEIQIPTEQEVKTLLDSAQNTPMLLPLQLAAFCGLRRSEISALTYADVQDGYIIINKAVVRGEGGVWHTKKPKSMAGYRRIKLPSVIEIGEGDPKAHLTDLTPNNLTDGCLHLSHGKIGMHSLRHYYASVLLKLGVPNKYAARQMGHAGEEMLQRVYQHLFPENVAEYDAQIAEKVSQV